ncbi:MAG: AI-2E family transporter [Alphaproteobacteria bacterium]|nr:AI-2E family transporter [Alphaproteobacteria bacterium]
MSMQPKTYMTFWGSVVLLFFAFVWLFKPVLTPFVLGVAIAYLLNPVVGFLARGRVSRFFATFLILFVFLFVAIGMLVLIAPVLSREAIELANHIPSYIDRFLEVAHPYLIQLQERLDGGNYAADIKSFLKDNIGKIAQVSGGVANGVAGGLASGGQAVISFLTILVLTPLVAFFMMLEWPRISAWVSDLIPRHNEKMIRNLLKEIDSKISGFVRGQITVAFMLGILYALALTIAGLNYGFLIGLSAGVLSIIPMVGSTLGLLVGIIVAWFQAGSWDYVAIVAAIFIVGQIIEGNILTPKLVGDSVGLHPLWVIFALMAGGSLFGILGMLLAVPVAAVIGVLTSFAILQYKNSPLYKKPVKKVAKKKLKK